MSEAAAKYDPSPVLPAGVRPSSLIGQALAALVRLADARHLTTTIGATEARREVERIAGWVTAAARRDRKNLVLELDCPACGAMPGYTLRVYATRQPGHPKQETPDEAEGYEVEAITAQFGPGDENDITGDLAQFEIDTLLARIDG